LVGFAAWTAGAEGLEIVFGWWEGLDLNVAVEGGWSDESWALSAGLAAERWFKD